MRQNRLLKTTALTIGGAMIATAGLAAGDDRQGGTVTRTPPPAASPMAPADRIGTPVGQPADSTGTPMGVQRSQSGTTPSTAGGQAIDPGNDMADARETLNEAVDVIATMRADPNLEARMRDARGIFVIPDFGRAALIAGVSGGSGVMLEQTGGDWSNPAFYDLGSISAGAQAGASGGAMAMLLMSDNAVAKFKQNNNFSVNADAGLSIIDWSAAAQASAGKGDVILWSDTAGLFAGAAVGVSDISFDDEETSAFYGRQVTAPNQVLASNMSDPAVETLKQALPQ